MIDIKTLSTTGLAVLTKAVNDFKREGFIDTVTAFDLTLEGIDPDEALDYAEALTYGNENG
ncbi:hypothetical protein [Rhizobium leguminosarum]|uniref:hypothetical protein n=1 Tax=Rhizobium leguminosarum TaxID=384 RepID=UPI00048A0CFB|nr:hypothetical protein [Rhizobium leguminosarum]